MQTLRFKLATAVITAGLAVALAGCGSPIQDKIVTPKPNSAAKPDTQTQTQTQTQPQEQTPAPDKPQQTDAAPAVDFKTPTSIDVLVNKQNGLPDGYKPEGLIDDPNIPFTFTEKDEKRFIRKDAAEALEKLFAGAKQDGIYLAGVSAYRSYETQEGLFNSYVKTQGEAEARRYSAVPGYSEHQTGLAIDVSGSTGACAAEDCFGDTPEAKWIAEHAAEYGFIVRYPQGKEQITGYAYEPWHIRYVGIPVAKEIAAKGLTLEEYAESKGFKSK